MPWKLVFSLILVVFLVVFIGFNLGNSCDISFGFARIQGVPVYLTILVSFLAGMLAATPFAFRLLRKKGVKVKTGADSPAADSQAPKPAQETGSGTVQSRTEEGPKTKKRKGRKASGGE